MSKKKKLDHDDSLDAMSYAVDKTIMGGSYGYFSDMAEQMSTKQALDNAFAALYPTLDVSKGKLTLKDLDKLLDAMGDQVPSKPLSMSPQVAELLKNWDEANKPKSTATKPTTYEISFAELAKKLAEQEESQ